MCNFSVCKPAVWCPFGESLRVASDDNGRKLVCACFHCVVCFQWHPGWWAVVFSSHCKSHSKPVCLIVRWSFHGLQQAGQVGQGNGRFALWTLRTAALQNLWADDTTLIFSILLSSPLFTQWLDPPVEGRYHLFEVYIHITHSSHEWRDLQEPHLFVSCLVWSHHFDFIAVHQQTSQTKEVPAIQYK